MIRNLAICFTALLVMASCKSAGSTPAVELNRQSITQALEASGQANGAEVAQALSASKPLLLVFWQSW